MSTAGKYRGGNLLSYKFKAGDLYEAALFLLTLLIWIDRILLTYIRAIIMRLPLIGSMADSLILITYIALIVLSLPKIVRSMRISDLFGSFAVLAVCILNVFFFPGNIAAMEEHLPVFLLYTFPLYYIGLSMDYERTCPWLYRLSVITIIAFTLYKLFVNAPMDEVQSLYHGDMWGSYNLLPHVGVVAMHMAKKPNVVNAAVSVLGFFMLASLGSRGPLICAILALVVYMMLFKSYRHPFLTRAMVVAAAAALLWNLDAIMLFLCELAEDVGLSVRIFEIYFEGAFTESAGRDVIRETLLNMIRERPMLGYGLYADYTAVGVYAHNIIVEFWLDFGVLVGTALFAAMIVVFLRAFKQSVSEGYVLLLLPLLASGFVKLFMSGSYLEEMYLFLLLGFCVSLNRKLRIKSKRS